MDKHYLLVSDFDQTLSFHDSGHALSEMVGIDGFADRVSGLSRLNLVQSGAELTYLLRHDPEYRIVAPRQDIQPAQVSLNQRSRLSVRLDPVADHDTALRLAARADLHRAGHGARRERPAAAAHCR